MRTIASIFFDEIRIERPLYSATFILPAVAKDADPFLLKIEDKIQLEPLPMIAGGGSVPRVITTLAIANDIVEHATGKGFGMTVDCCPGVWLVREELPEFDDEGKPLMTTVYDDKGKAVQRQRMRPATPAEKEQMFLEDLDEARSRQHNYCEYLINQGEALNDKPEQRVLISSRMKKAAIYSGKEVEWLQELKHDDAHACPFCTKLVRRAAVKCPNCQEIIDYERYAAMEADRKEAIAAEKKRRAA